MVQRHPLIADVDVEIRPGAADPGRPRGPFHVPAGSPAGAATATSFVMKADLMMSQAIARWFPLCLKGLGAFCLVSCVSLSLEP